MPLGESRDRPRFAKDTALAREIRAVLELINPIYEREVKYDGYCGAASEAYLHLAGGRGSGLKVKRNEGPGFSHWWLENESGEIIDMTLAPRDRRELQRHPRRFRRKYANASGAMFQNGYKRPSKRAAAIMELVESRRRASA